MSNFIPDLNDPRTRGWGGHEYDYGDDRGYFIFSWLGFIVLFALPFTQTPGGILTATLLLWLMLGILTPNCQEGGNLHAPAVICDPQGLTIYNSNQRIEHQWRWQALDSVSARNNGLRIIPRDDEALTYRDFRLGRDMETLLAIAVVATGYLHGRAPSVPPAPSADINHIWYKPQDDIVWLSSSNLLLPVLVLAFCWPGLIQYWPDIPQGTITVAIVVGFFDLFETRTTTIAITETAGCVGASSLITMVCISSKPATEAASFPRFPYPGRTSPISKSQKRRKGAIPSTTCASPTASATITKDR